MSFIFQFITVVTLLLSSTSFAAGVYTDKEDGTVDDYQLVGSPSRLLTWTKNANPANKKMSYGDAEKYIKKMNAGKVENFGYTGWRLPSKEEMDHHLGVKFKLIGQPKTLNKLPSSHPFENFDKNSQYWMKNLFGSMDPTMFLTTKRHVWPVRTLSKKH